MHDKKERNFNFIGRGYVAVHVCNQSDSTGRPARIR